MASHKDDSRGHDDLFPPGWVVGKDAGRLARDDREVAVDPDLDELVERLIQAPEFDQARQITRALGLDPDPAAAPAAGARRDVGPDRDPAPGDAPFDADSVADLLARASAELERGPVPIDDSLVPPGAAGSPGAPARAATDPVPETPSLAPGAAGWADGEPAKPRPRARRPSDNEIAELWHTTRRLQQRIGVATEEGTARAEPGLVVSAEDRARARARLDRPRRGAGAGAWVAAALVAALILVAAGIGVFDPARTWLHLQLGWTDAAGQAAVPDRPVREAPPGPAD
jgi:hypothetical protein